MGFRLTMFLANLLVPAIMITAGWWMWKHPPKEINALMGYRTTMSTKNQDTWRFAHAYCGRLWVWIGLLMVVLSALLQLVLLKTDRDAFEHISLVLTMLQTASLVVSIIPVERALRRTFNKDGTRRTDANDCR